MQYKTDHYSCMKWLERKDLLVRRYLRKNYQSHDREYVYNLLMENPIEGKKLIQNYRLTNKQKINMICQWMIRSEQLTCLVFGDQRQGKDVTICFFIYECGVRYPYIKVVTLGNIKKPPFVGKEDMYFAYDNIPPSTGKYFTFVYCSEAEVQYPCREGASKENKAFAILSGTMAQNHHKFVAAVKLAAKTDINLIRDCNMRMFKYIDPEKLNVEGTERVGILSGLGELLLPKKKSNKSEVLVAFNDNLLKVNVPLPKWWSQEYSEMFAGISKEKIAEYVLWADSNDYKIQQIVLAVKQKFRYSITEEDVKNCITYKQL